MTFDGTLPSRWDISPRLMARWTFDDNSTIEVSVHGGYVLTDPNGEVLNEGNDFQPGAGVTCWADVLCAFVSFMEHDAETYRHFMGPVPDDEIHDGYLFGDDGAHWCYQHEDELSYLRNEMDPEGIR